MSVRGRGTVLMGVVVMAGLLLLWLVDHGEDVPPGVSADPASSQSGSMRSPFKPGVPRSSPADVGPIATAPGPVPDPSLPMRGIAAGDTRGAAWVPGPDATMDEIIERLAESGSWFLSVKPTAFVAIDVLRAQPRESLDVLREALSEERLLEAVKRGSTVREEVWTAQDHRKLVLLGVLGTAAACDTMEVRAQFLYDYYSRMVAVSPGMRRLGLAPASDLSPWEANRQRASSRLALRSAIFGAAIGRCPNLRGLCRQLLPQRQLSFEQDCAMYLAWVFPREALPARSTPDSRPWPDPPYWAANPGGDSWPRLPSR